MNEFRKLKKEKEKYFVEIFLDVLNLPYNINSLIHNRKDPPDFIYLYNGKKIAIELTQLFSDDSLKAVETQQEKIQSTLLLCLNKSNLPFLEVSLFFNQSKSIFKKNTGEYSDILYNVIFNNIPDVNEWHSIKNDFNGSIPDEINYIRIARFSDLDSHFVSVPKFGYFNHNFIDLLQILLVKKEKTLKNYSEDFNERWLLVYDDVSSGASMFLPYSNTKNNKYKSSFDRLFFLSTFGKNIFELNKQ